MLQLGSFLLIQLVDNRMLPGGIASSGALHAAAWTPRDPSL
jgi:hypothetical protein